RFPSNARRARGTRDRRCTSILLPPSRPPTGRYKFVMPMGFDQLAATGANQRIAIVDAYGNKSIKSDLNTFCSQFGITPTTVQVLGNNTGIDSGWALETALDVEWAHAIAPGA